MTHFERVHHLQILDPIHTNPARDTIKCQKLVIRRYTKSFTGSLIFTLVSIVMHGDWQADFFQHSVSL